MPRKKALAWSNQQGLQPQLRHGSGACWGGVLMSMEIAQGDWMEPKANLCGLGLSGCALPCKENKVF